MPDREQKSLGVDLDAWLRSLGFERGNPFAAVEADEERDILPEYFVDVDAYERIKGDKTIIVFAPRGGGKSALRVVLASQAAPILPESKILAIEYTDFAPLIRKLRVGEAVTVDDHVELILRAGVWALFTSCCGYSPNSQAEKQEEKRAKKLRIQRVKEIMPAVRSRLARWMRTYQPQFLEAEELYERYHALDAGFVPDWEEFNLSASKYSIRKIVSQSALKDNPVALLLADLNDASAEKNETAHTPKERVTAFLNLSRSIGFDTVQVLMDRMDEAEETENDPQKQADILEPLLAELPILELQGIAFKFLLSQEAHQIIISRPSFRRDRLMNIEVTVHWRIDRLKQLLDERLRVFSDHKVQELVQICVEGPKKSQKSNKYHLAGEQIETEMLDLAQGSPRRLLKAGQFLLDAHLSERGGRGLIGTEDWQVGRRRFLEEFPIILRIRRDRFQASIGEREVKLTSMQHAALMTLACSPSGECDRQEIIEKVWPKQKGGVSDDALNKLISRIRGELGDDPKNPLYLLTIRDKGFQLINYEIQ
jgi:hypothetical protein